MSSNTTATSRSSNLKVTTTQSKFIGEGEHVRLSLELDYLFEKELISKQNKHIHIMDRFGPSRNTHHLCAKFYARHDQQMPPSYTAFVPFICGAASQHNTEANVYGWLPETVHRANLLKELNFVHAPKLRCHLTVFGEKLESDIANARPAFNGLRFFLQ